MTSDDGRSHAKAQLDSIRDMVARLRNATDDDREAIEEEIFNDPLEVSVRSGWVTPYTTMTPDEFRILLCTGGPAVQIIGDLDDNGGVYGATRLEYQDWFTPWTNYPLDDDEASDLHDYALMFFPA